PVPENGLLGVGVEVPLIRGMFTDENRQALRAYKIKRDWQVVLNDSSYNQIFYSAIYDYVLWSVANQNIEVAHDLILIREQRYENVVKQYRGGFSSPLDTLDAFSQLQAAERSLLEAETKALKAKYQAANHIWNDLLNDKIETLSPEGIDNVIEYLNRLTSRDFDLNNHNFITSYQFNIKSLQTERALWREMMKPALDISLMSLSGPVTDFETINSFSTSNYLVGFNVEIPLNIRKAHGKVRALSLKMENMELKRQLKAREVMNKWLTVIATTNLQQEQYEVMSANASNLVRIRDLEEQRFNLGESSLFKLNSREDKMFEAQAKRLKSAEQYAQVQLNQLLYLQVLTPERLRSN
ncbi:MAG: TolC family protein, partial [Flavobacteriales bacterium]|nr:TolC family protein [Flavobacteriales bacterium]